MSKELVISSNRHETRVAILEEDQLVEIYFQRANEYSLAGSVHKGRVTRVLPGMQSAFVDLGLERDTFLYVSDFFEEHGEDYDKVTGGAEERPAPRVEGGGGGGRERSERGDRGERGERGGRHRDRDRGDRDRDRDRDRRGGDRGGRSAEPREVEAVAPAPAEEVHATPAPAVWSEVEQHEAVEVESPAEVSDTDEAPVEEAMAAGAVAQPAAAVDQQPAGEHRAPSQEGRGGDRRDDRDRRGGRRGRRRRGRGRGFPESKYASEPPSSSSAPADSIDEEPGEPEMETAAEDIIILPGESLAKYRHAAPAAAAAAFTAEPEAAEEEPEVVEHEAIEPEVVAEVAAHAEAPVPVQPDTIITTEDPGEHPPANAIPDAPVHPERTEHEHVHAVSDVLTGAAGAAAALESEPTEIKAASVEIIDGHSHPGLAILEDEEDREIQEMILETEADEEADAAQEAAEAALEGHYEAAFDGPAAEFVEGDVEAEPSEEAAAVEEGEATLPAEAGAPTEAHVRESSGRYLQRQGGGGGGGRRSRRGRGGDRGDRGDRGGRGGDRGGRDGGRHDESRGGGAGQPQQQQSTQPQQQSAPPARPQSSPGSGYPSITDLLKEGQEIIVQIAKEPLGQKGARITSHIALPGRFVVFMPTLDHMGVSRKIASDEERHRLKRILQNARVGITGGCIIRTAGEGKTEEEITADIHFLYNLWLDIRQKAEKRPAPLLLHHDLDIVQRILRDQFNESFKAVWVDNEEMYESVMRFVQRFQPALVGKIKLYTRQIPIFDAFNITMELEKALRPKVWLRSGGYIVINQTEALVAIDINTGKFVGKSNRLEDTIVRTNVEAVKEIVRQIRLRDLGGIIVIDFIDMDERKNRARVMQALEEAMRLDRAPYKILQFNDFGLVAITRKRVKQSLERALCSPCPYCEGAGSVKSVTTVLGEILQEAHKIAAAVDGSNVMLRCNPEVAKVLKSHHNQYLEELEEILKRPVLVKSDPAIHQEKFDLA